MMFLSLLRCCAAVRWCGRCCRGRRLLSFRSTPSPPRDCRRRAAVVGAVGVVVVVARIVGVVPSPLPSVGGYLPRAPYGPGSSPLPCNDHGDHADHAMIRLRSLCIDSVPLGHLMGMRGDWGPVQKEVPASRRWFYLCRARALGLSGMWHTSVISVAVCVRSRGCACIPMCAFACVLRHRYARDSI